MKKANFMCLAMVVVLMLAGCRENKPQDTMNPVLNDVPTEITEGMEATEETIPGVEDSIFDGNMPIIEMPAQTQTPEQEETEPTTGINVPSQAPSSGGLQDPEAPDEPDAPAAPETTAPDGNQSETNVSNQSEYQKFHAMSPAEQQAFMESFESIEAFFDWYDRVKAEHEAANPPIEVGDGSIDLGDILGGNN